MPFIGTKFSSFAIGSDDLSNSIASVHVTRKLCTSYVDLVGFAAFVSSRLIALDKEAGVRPKCIGEVIRRLIGKVILSVIKPDILAVTDCSQL